MSTTGHELEVVNVQGLKASMKKNGNYAILNDCICSTAGATAAKVTNTVPPSFTLTNKAKILVKFTYGINVAGATLQVGENAAKPIFYQGSALDAGRVKAGMFVLLQYDGTNFNILGDIAKMDEYYKDLHAGLADNLFGETQTNDMFTFRPTAGIQDIESGEPPLGGASVKRIEGNAVAWNQLNDPQKQSISYEGFSISWVGDHYHITGQSSEKPYLKLTFGEGASLLSRTTRGHVYYFAGLRNNNNNTIHVTPLVGPNAEFNNPHITASNGPYLAILSEPLFSEYLYFYNETVDVDYYPQCIDLTLLFGSGNEPSTVAEFESWLERNIGLKDYYPYNAGELIPVKDFKVKSVGFNAWDEEWYSGITTNNCSYTFSGEEVTLNVTGDDPYIGEVKAKGEKYYANYGPLLKVLPNTTYHFHATNNNFQGNYITAWNKDKVCVAGWQTVGHGYANFDFTTPSDCCYISFRIGTGSGVSSGSYTTKICISLSYDDDKDGTYEEHWEHETAIDVTKIYGKLNGQGEYVQVFPDGIRKAGTSKDVLDLKNGVATVNISKKTLQASNFISDGLSGGTHVQRVMTDDLFSDMKKTSTQGVVLSHVQASKIGGIYVSFDGYWIQEGYIAFGDNRMYVSITGYNTVASIGAICPFDVVYELATPLTYTDLVFRNNGVDTPVSEIKYAVDDYGTEELLLGNDEDVVSVAPTMTIKYGINAADTVASLPHNYVSAKPQQLLEGEQKVARQNIGAASQKDMIVVKKQLELIDKKVENDYYVDMGLPSGLLWAKRNIDLSQADKFAPSEYSYDASFFSWGNTDGHNPTGTTFDYDFGTSNDGPYASTPGAKLTGNISPSYDAAHVNLGEPWRMPTTEEIKELFDNCDFVQADGTTVISPSTVDKRVTVNGAMGIYLKSKINGNRIFFPCTGLGLGTSWNGCGSFGDYWSSSILTGTVSYNLGFNSNGIYPQDSLGRFYGFPIRPVM